MTMNPEIKAAWIEGVEIWATAPEGSFREKETGWLIVIDPPKVKEAEAVATIKTQRYPGGPPVITSLNLEYVERHALRLLASVKYLRDHPPVDPAKVEQFYQIAKTGLNDSAQAERKVIENLLRAGVIKEQTDD